MRLFPSMHRIAMAGMTVAMSVGLMAVVPATAASACSGGECFNHTSPVNTGCWNSATIYARTAPIQDGNGRTIGTVSLRWSRDCGTVWSQVTNSTGHAAWAVNQVERAPLPSSLIISGLDSSCNVNGVNQCKDYIASGKYNYGLQINDAGSLQAFAVGYLCADAACSTILGIGATTDF
jgi:hypothetical protein